MVRPLEKLPLFISAGAAIIVLLACIASSAALYWMAAWVSLAIVLFYFIGHGLRMFLITTVFPYEEILEDDFEVEDEYDHEAEMTGSEEAEEAGEAENEGIESLPDGVFNEDEDDGGYDDDAYAEGDDGEEDYEGDEEEEGPEAENAPVGDAFLDT